MTEHANLALHAVLNQTRPPKLTPVHGQIPRWVKAAIRQVAAERFEGNFSQALRLVLAAGLETLRQKQEAADAAQPE